MQHNLSRNFSEQSFVTAVNVFSSIKTSFTNPKIKIMAIRYIFQYKETTRWKRCAPTDTQLIDACIFLIPNLDQKYITEIIDIITTFAPTHRQYFLDSIQTKNIERKIDLPNKIPNKTIYQDSQNVHNSKLNESVIECLETLHKKYSEKIKTYDIQTIQQILCLKYTDHNIEIISGIDYILESISVFGKSQISLLNAFLYIWLFILDNPSDDIELRLIEELKEMKGLCSTGHLARLINVMQGFTQDENLIIKISNVDQINAVVKNYLTTELQRCDDEKVLDGMLTGDEKFVEFIRQKVSEKIFTWQQEYGKENLDVIAKTINHFSKTIVYEV